MITPEGTRGEHDRPKRGKSVLLGVVAIVIFAGLAVVGALTTPDPSTGTTITLALSTTTTEVLAAPEPSVDNEEFSVSDIAQGEPFTWEQTLPIDTGYTLELTDHDDYIYLFVTDSLPFDNPDGGGLRAWRSIDGSAWESLGQVIGGQHVIPTVSSTGQGLIALEKGEAGSGFTVWQSDDGINWQPEEVRMDGLNEFETFTPREVGGTADMLLVTGWTGLDTDDLVEERIDYELREHISEYGTGFDITADAIKFTVFGLGSIPIVVMTGEDLGLSDQEEHLAIEASEGESQILMNADAGWVETAMPEQRGGIESVSGTPWGEIVAFGFGNSGASGWVTSNGVDWEEVGPGDHFGGEIWGDGIVSPSLGLQPSMSVLGSDGVWADIGPGRLFPHAFSWDVGPLAAGPGGVATLARVWARPGEPPEPPTLTNQDGATLTIDFGAAQFMLNGVPWRIGEELPTGLEIDLETGILSFHEPGTDEVLATFELQAIDDAYRSWLRQNYWPARHQAFMFTRDGTEWTIQNLAQFGDTEILSFEVTDTHVVAVTSERVPVDRTQPIGLEVWSAEIP